VIKFPFEIKIFSKFNYLFLKEDEDNNEIINDFWITDNTQSKYIYSFS
jgi:hypothetical protein